LNPYRVPVHSHEFGVRDVGEPAELAGTVLLFVFTVLATSSRTSCEQAAGIPRPEAIGVKSCGFATPLFENPNSASDNSSGTSTSGERRVTPIHMVSSCVSPSDAYVISIQP
jgi:hypothetical protein